MKRLIAITAAGAGIVLFFFLYTNPSTDSLKKELPGLLKIAPEDMKDCITIGKTENWFVYSRFCVRNTCENWYTEYIGFAGNFKEVKWTPPDDAVLVGEQ